MQAFGGVYDNVYYWSKGIAKDQNGDGIVNAGESYEVLNGQPSYDLGLSSQTILHTNMWAWLPERGVRRYVSAVYLPQTIEITNAVNNSGRGYPNIIKIPNSRVSAITTQTQADAHYSVFMRVRPERTQPHANNSWLFNFGHTTKKGIMVGTSGVYSPKEGSYTQGGVKYLFTNYVSSVYFYHGGYCWTPGSQCVFVADTWNDVVVSVDGQKMSILVSHDSHLYQDFNSISNSNVQTWAHWYGETTAGDAYNLVPNSGAVFQVGSESYATGQIAWTNKINNNAWKAFRGAVQCLALWTNSLTKAQMLEAAAYPRTDLWRVGLENDSTAECETAASGAEVDPDACRWAVPNLRAGESVTFKFPLNTTGEAQMNNFLRIKTTSQSPSACLKVKVNEKELEPKWIQSGKMEWWFVDVTKVPLVGGATNTITVTRTDAGSGAVGLDSVRYGGSFQYGEADNTNYDFYAEGKTQDETFDLMGANWAVGNRAIFTTGSYVNDSGKTVISPYTNQVISFSMPDDLGQITKYRIKSYSLGTGKIQFNLNGHDIGEQYAPNKSLSIDIPDEYLQPTGNILKYMNVMPRTATQYLAPDYIRIEALRPKTGLIIMVR